MTFPKNTNPTEALIRISKILPGTKGTDTLTTAVNRLNAAIEIAKEALSLPSQEAEAAPVDHVRGLREALTEVRDAIMRADPNVLTDTLWMPEDVLKGATVVDRIDMALSPIPQEPTTCERCQGNGEIVTDWERYRHPHEGDIGDEAVASCPDCGGEGIIDHAPSQEADPAVVLTDEPVAQVIWYDPRLDTYDAMKPRKIIDASIAFMEKVALGTKLYAAPQPAIPSPSKDLQHTEREAE